MAVARGLTFRTELEDLACGVLNDRMAPAGYVYFLVADHQATLATVLFDRSKRRDCLRHSLTGSAIVWNKGSDGSTTLGRLWTLLDAEVSQP
jgi:hypothetical protein